MYNKEEFEKIADNLAKSPLFAMSLSEKELFHSNFWAWLFERTPYGISYAKIFFPSITKISCVTREEEHRDVTIWESQNRAYVIENKLKSLPRKSQLEEYQKALEYKKCFCQGCLTGVIGLPMAEQRALDKWHFISYKTIGERILDIAEKEQDTFEKQLIIQYAQMLIDLQWILVKNEYMQTGTFLSYVPNSNKLKKLRMADFVAKLNANQFVNRLENKRQEILSTKVLEKYVKDGRVDVIIGQYFSNSQALVDVKLKYMVGESTTNKPWENEAIRIGIQIQGNQYRRLLEMQVRQLDNPKNISHCCDIIFDIGARLGWFERDAPAKGNFEKALNMRNSYNSYKAKGMNPLDSNFVYQYKIIEDRSFDALEKEIIQDIKIATEILYELISKKQR